MSELESVELFLSRLRNPATPHLTAIGAIQARDLAIRADERRRVATWLRRLSGHDVLSVGETEQVQTLARMIEEGIHDG